MRRIPIYEDLKLGTIYRVYWENFGWGKCRFYTAKFIKVTPKGYNFLDLETNKCILKQHLYRNKRGIFFKNSIFKILRLELKTEKYSHNKRFDNKILGTLNLFFNIKYDK